MFWRVGHEINEKKKLETKGGESKEKEKKEKKLKSQCEMLNILLKVLAKMRC